MGEQRPPGKLLGRAREIEKLTGLIELTHDGLLRRWDHPVDSLGGDPALHYPSDYRQFDGILVPTRRRVYVRNPDGTPDLGVTSITIDVTNMSFD